MSWAPKIRSSDFDAVADDAAKDDENVSFLAVLPLDQQVEWIARLGWLRLADRLSENQMVAGQSSRFEDFCRDWRHSFIAEGNPSGEHESVWREMRAAWRTPSGELREPRAVAAFGDYLDALGEYTGPNFELTTLEEHDRMLRRLTGNLVEVFPFLCDSQRDAASRFGALDQLLNNLRDIAEDAAQGLCFFPRDVLARFDVTRASLISGSAIATPGYRAMMSFWVDEHLPRVRREAEPFVEMRDLHPSLVLMRQTCLARHARIESVLRACNMDYVQFARVYWGAPLHTEGKAAG